MIHGVSCELRCQADRFVSNINVLETSLLPSVFSAMKSPDQACWSASSLVVKVLLMKIVVMSWTLNVLQNVRKCRLSHSMQQQLKSLDTT